MALKVFYSLHFGKDYGRTSQIRNKTIVEGNTPASKLEWEAITTSGDAAIEQWVNDHVAGCDCLVVLIGEQTASRKWVRYEIIKAWNSGKAVVGIRINKLKEGIGKKSPAGDDPFSKIILDNGVAREHSGSIADHFTNTLASEIKLHSAPSGNSREVYEYILSNIVDWVEAAILWRKTKGHETFESDTTTGEL